METADPIDDTAAPIYETESPAASDEPNTDTPVTAEPTEDPYIDIPTYNPDMDPTVTATPDFDIPDGHSITPGGNAGLVDDLRDGERDFITVQTRSGEYFYIIIDHTQNGNNVYFLNMVDTQDLLALLDDDTKSKLGCICIDKCSAGHVNENCPVCSLNMAECQGKDITTTSAPQGSSSASNPSGSSNEPAPDNGTEKEAPTAKNYLSLALIVLAIGGAVAFYFIKKRKSSGKQNSSDDDYEDEDDEEDYGEEFDPSSDSDLIDDDDVI